MGLALVSIVLMWFFIFKFQENFHHLYDLLSQLKISVLDAERKEAKHKYQDALKAYVIRYFGRPLEKLNVRTIEL